MTSQHDLAAHYLENIIAVFRSQKALAEKAMAQINDDAGFHWRPDPESNSIAVNIRHLSGNMVSRWTDFLTTDGEKPDRHRDTEFIEEEESRERLMERWERGWSCLFDALTSLTPDDLGATIEIRREPHSVVEAINRQISHYGYHVGQIVYIAKHVGSERWKSLTIPRGQSEQYLAAPPQPQ